MPSHADGLRTALRRIAAERETRAGFLDLGNLGLTEWPEGLETLTHLTRLNLGIGWLDERLGFRFAEPGLDASQNVLPAVGAPWRHLPQLQVLSLAGERGPGSPWGDLRGFEHLIRLRVLNLSFTDVDDLTPLAGLTQLVVLDVSYTFIACLAVLRGHTALRYLDAAHARITNVDASFVRLPALETLVLHSNPIAGETVPAEVIAPPDSANCMETLRRWLAREVKG